MWLSCCLGDWKWLNITTGNLSGSDELLAHLCKVVSSETVKNVNYVMSNHSAAAAQNCYFTEVLLSSFLIMCLTYFQLTGNKNWENGLKYLWGVFCYRLNSEDAKLSQQQQAGYLASSLITSMFACGLEKWM